MTTTSQMSIRVSNSRHMTSFAVSQTIVSLSSFLVCIYLASSTFREHADDELTSIYSREVDSHVYQWPALAFGTAFMLNFLTLLFEREPTRFQVALVACHISLLAGIFDVLAWKGVTPVFRDALGQGLHIGRMIMWLHTTPHMVYLLSIISDFTRAHTHMVMAADCLMILTGIGACLAPNLLLAAAFMFGSCVTFLYVVKNMWQMFDVALADAKGKPAALSLYVLRASTVGVWFIFPLFFAITKTGLVSVSTEECLWSVADLLGKMIFSSSLLQGNFMAMEQRRLVAMRAVEEGNRNRVIHELKALVDRKEWFMSSLSHELRTPLNGIIGLSDALLAGCCGQLNEGAHKSISIIKTSGFGLLNLINDILDAASMQQGKLRTKLEKVNLQRVVEDVLALCHPLAKPGVKLVNNVPSNIPIVLGDTGRIIQIFYNLIGNACKFTHSGTISITACHELDVVVSVCDTGIGIPEEKFDQIFSPFEQVDMGITRRYGGTGLGLSLVKQLVEAHEGHITVRSKLGVGTTFTFTLKEWGKTAAAPDDQSQWGDPDGADKFSGVKSAQPGPVAVATSKPTATTEAAAGQQHQQPPGDSNPRIRSHVPGMHANTRRRKLAALQLANAKLRVLSVDDDPINQLVIHNLLEPEGFEVAQAMDGQEALRMAADMPTLPDLILLDVMMPGMSGYEVCRKLRELYPTSCVPIIMVSAKSKEEHIVEGLAAGANDYVVKPFGRQEILARIAAHLKFRDAVVQAEMYGGSEAGMTGDVTDAAGGLASFLDIPGRGSTLPPLVKAQIEMGKFLNVQMFEQLTMVSFRLVNIEELTQQLTASELAVALAHFHVAMDDLMERNKVYLMDDPLQDHYTAVAGLRDEEDQVVHALDFAQGLLDAADQVELPHGCRLDIAVGVHTMPAQGVVVGVSHPVMCVIGQLQNEVAQLLSVCPANCVHVSSRTRAALPDGTSHSFVGCCSKDGGHTFLLQAGSWSSHIQGMADKCLVCTKRYRAHPQNTAARRLQPLQCAMMDLVRISPSFVLKTGHSWGTGHQEQSVADSPSANGNDNLAKVNHSGDSQVLTRLRHDKEVLERQLEKVSTEAARLQDRVDALEFQSASRAVASREGAASLSSSGGPSTQHLRNLEVQLAARNTEVHLLSLQLADATMRAAALEVDSEGAGLKPSMQRKSGNNLFVSTTARSSVGGVSVLAAGGSAGFSRGAQAVMPRGSISSPVVAGNTNRQPSEAQQLARCFTPSTILSLDRQPSVGASMQRLPAAAAIDIGVLLTELGMPQLTPKFLAEEITPDLLQMLDAAALKELGVSSVGARAKLMAAAHALSERDM